MPEYRVRCEDEDEEDALSIEADDEWEAARSLARRHDLTSATSPLTALVTLPIGVVRRFEVWAEESVDYYAFLAEPDAPAPEKKGAPRE